jgi:Thiopurine S-methyltransferase (TPMT)
MAREVNPWNETFYDRVIQTKIGQGLREQYEQDLARSLPHKLSTLLMQLTEKENSKHGQRPVRKKPAR